MKTFLKRRKFLIAFTILTIGSGFFVGKIFAVGDVGHVVISEVLVDGENGGEFVELYNPTNEKINFDGWFWCYYSSSKKDWNKPYRKKEFPSSALITANEFYLIGLKGYPIDNGDTISDWQPYSSKQLNNTRGTVAIFSKNPKNESLVDAVGWGDINLKEEVSAKKPDKERSLQRKFLDSVIQDTNNNGEDFFVGDPNPRDISCNENNSDEGENNDNDEDDNMAVIYSSEIRINEFLPDPKEKPEKNYEYIELYNYGDEEIDLKNWELKDANILKKENGKGKKLSGTIRPKKYLAFYKTVSLNNGGDKIKLFNPNGDEVDYVAYGKAEENYAYGFNGEAWEWTPFLTPGKANQFKVKKNYSHSVHINEILPNPSGDEKLNEYIELYNSGDKTIDLSGWILKDSSKRGKFIFSENSLIKAKNFLIIYRADFKFAMNNSGSETVYLLDPNENIVSSISYSKAKEDVSYNFSKSDWRWSRFLTPGEKNKFNQIPRVEIKKDKKIYKNVYADFKVKINDPDKDKIKIVWDFGDGRKSYKKKTRHKYKETGKYSASLKVFDGSEEVIKKFKIKVRKFPRPKVRITRLLPNPKGKDSELEWIEIKNKSKKEINLKNWSIATGSSGKKLVNHPIYEDFFIGSGKVKKIMRDLSRFSLNNKKCRIELRYPDGKVAYKIKYKKEGGVKDDEIYGKVKGEKWEWTRNVETVLDVKIIEDVEIVLDDEDVEIVEDEKYVGGQSIELSDDKKIELLIGELDAEALEKITINLGSLDIEEINNIYIFNSLVGEDEHYALKFLEKLFQKINQTFNNRLNLLN